MKHIFLSIALILVIILPAVTVMAPEKVHAIAGDEVKFRGTLVGEPSLEPDTYRRHEVRVEEILMDQDPYLQMGRVEQVWVRLYGTDLPFLEQAHVGDRVEVYGFINYGDSSTGYIIAVFEPYHYLKKIGPPTLSVDVWTNKGGQGLNVRDGNYKFGETVTVLSLIHISEPTRPY